MGFEIIQAKIKEKFDANKGDGKVLVEVYEEHRTEFEGYPSVTFEPSDLQSDFFTTNANKRQYTYKAFVHQEIGNLGRAKAIKRVQKAVDVLVEEFERDYSLGGIVDWCLPMPMQFGFYDEGSGMVCYAELKIICIKEVSLGA
jgi:hypothetical protein